MDIKADPDFSALLALSNAHHVEYMIVGGYALAFHGAPRFTGDLDVYIKADAVNGASAAVNSSRTNEPRAGREIWRTWRCLKGSEASRLRRSPCDLHSYFC